MRENIHNTVLPIIYKNCIMNFNRKSTQQIMPFYFWRARNVFFRETNLTNFCMKEFRQRLTLNILNSKPEKL